MAPRATPISSIRILGPATEREFARASRVALAPLTHLSSAALMLS